MKTKSFFTILTMAGILIFLSGIPAVPRWLLKLLSKNIIIALLHSQKPSRFYKVLFSLTLKMILFTKGIKAILTGDFKRIVNYFKLAK